LLGTYSPPQWYNFNNLAGGSSFPTGEPFFCSDTGSTYYKHQLDISALKGTPSVAFRFVFLSDGSVTRAGAAIDNFEISGPPNTGPLPVQMLSFNADAEDGYNMLHWSTASEVNNSGFVVERSRDGNEFNRIGFVAGAGNASSVNEYSFKDSDIGSDVLYYRLKQVDNDGAFEYSQVIAIKNTTKTPFAIKSVYPNPFSKEIAIVFNKVALEPIRIKIFNAEGQIVIDESYAAFRNNLFINTESLQAGLYFITVESGDQKLVQRITKY
jgi:hypothetical protein